MNKIPVYESELAVAGLAEKVQADNLVAFHAPIFSLPENADALAKAIANLVVASEKDSDLYRTKSILVTTNWNKNDDVFNSVEAWLARSTPSHKPTNLGHDEHELVGHITDTWAIRTDGSIIPDNTSPEDLPHIYHIVNGAVIYKSWSDKKYIERTEKLISDIESGEMFVSMECFFTDFDYALMREDGSYEVKVRDEATAFLTKHLRAYGGTGEYNGTRIGRVLRHITFCGKGYVEQPANPDSIIFNSPLHHVAAKLDIEESDSLEETGVSLSTGDKSPNNNLTQTESETMSEKLEAQVAELQKELAAARDDLAKAGVEKLNIEITELKASVISMTEQSEADKTKISESDAKIDELTKELETIQASKVELEKTLEEVRAAELVAKRVATLVDGDVDKEAAEGHVETFSNLDDEQFAVIATTLIEAAKPKKEKKEDEDDKSKGSEESEEEQDDAEANATDENLENAEANASDESEGTPNAEADDNSEQAELAETRAQVQSAMASLFGVELDKEEQEN